MDSANLVARSKQDPEHVDMRALWISSLPIHEWATRDTDPDGEQAIPAA